MILFFFWSMSLYVDAQPNPSPNSTRAPHSSQTNCGFLTLAFFDGRLGDDRLARVDAADVLRHKFICIHIKLAIFVGKIEFGLVHGGGGHAAGEGVSTVHRVALHIIVATRRSLLSSKRLRTLRRNGGLLLSAKTTATATEKDARIGIWVKDGAVCGRAKDAGLTGDSVGTRGHGIVAVGGGGGKTRVGEGGTNEIETTGNHDEKQEDAASNETKENGVGQARQKLATHAGRVVGWTTNSFAIIVFSFKSSITSFVEVLI
jgi:hypothetical protein